MNLIRAFRFGLYGAARRRAVIGLFALHYATQLLDAGWYLGTYSRRWT